MLLNSILILLIYVECLAHCFKREFVDSLRNKWDKSLLKGRYPICLGLEQQLCLGCSFTASVSITNLLGSPYFHNFHTSEPFLNSPSKTKHFAIQVFQALPEVLQAKSGGLFPSNVRETTSGKFPYVLCSINLALKTSLQ